MRTPGGVVPRGPGIPPAVDGKIFLRLAEAARPAEVRGTLVQLRRLLQDGLVELVVADTANRMARNIADLRAIGLDISRAGVRLVFVSP